jgi:putative endonuclease
LTDYPILLECTPPLDRVSDGGPVGERIAAGRGSAWLERLVRDQEVAGSNPVAPIVDYFVYVLVSETSGRRYVGSSGDLADRLSRHNSGQSKATKHGAPWRLVHTETFATRSDAVRRERYFKTGKGREDLDCILAQAGDISAAQPG